MPLDNNPYLLHSSTLVSKPMSDPSIFTQTRQPAASTFNTPPLGVNTKGGTSPLALISMQRHSAPHHQPPLLAIKEEPRLEHRPRLSLSVSHVPGKTRKRHKVATSCNRCRQNKVYRNEYERGRSYPSCAYVYHSKSVSRVSIICTRTENGCNPGFVILIKKVFIFKRGLLCLLSGNAMVEYRARTVSGTKPTVCTPMHSSRDLHGETCR